MGKKKTQSNLKQKTTNLKTPVWMWRTIGTGFVFILAVVRGISLPFPNTILVAVTRRCFSQQDKFGGKYPRDKEGDSPQLSWALPESWLGNHDVGSRPSDAVSPRNIFVMAARGCAFTICDSAQSRRHLAQRICDLWELDLHSVKADLPWQHHTETWMCCWSKSCAAHFIGFSRGSSFWQ